MKEGKIVLIIPTDYESTRNELMSLDSNSQRSSVNSKVFGFVDTTGGKSFFIYDYSEDDNEHKFCVCIGDNVDAETKLKWEMNSEEFVFKRIEFLLKGVFVFEIYDDLNKAFNLLDLIIQAYELDEPVFRVPDLDKPVKKENKEEK